MSHDDPTPQEVRDAYRRTFDGPDGKMVLRHLLRMGGVLSRGFTGDPVALAYAEGRRTLALQVVHTAIGAEDRTDDFLQGILSKEPLPPIPKEKEEDHE